MKTKQNQKLVEGKKYHKGQGRNKQNRKIKKDERKKDLVLWKRKKKKKKKKIKTFSLTQFFKKIGSKSVTSEIKMENLQPTLKKQRGS